MALDPSIALGIRQPEFRSPTATLGSLMQMQAQQQQLRANSMQMQAQERAQRDDVALRTAIQRRSQPGGDLDWDGVVSDLEENGNGTVAMKVRENVYKQRKELAEGMKAQQENLKTRLGLAAQIAQGIGDEGTFQRGKKAIGSLLGEDLAGQLGDTYDPARVKQAVAWGMTAKEQADAQHAAAQDAAKAIELSREGPKKAAEVFEAWTGSASKLFSVADNEQGWQKARGLLKQGGAPEAVLAQFAPEFSPEAKQAAATVSIAPEKRAELAGQAEGRAQTATYQRGMLAQGMERIGLARKQLAAAQTQPEAMGPVADMVLQNPDLLKDFTPKERGKILTHIATEKDGAMPNKRRESLLSMLDATDATIAQLETGPGLGGAVGAKGPSSAFGWMDEPMAGTSAADYTSYFNTLKSQLTLPRMEMMRGLGAMSEREFKTLGDSATSLNRNMSEKAFVTELTKVKNTLSDVRKRLLSGTAPKTGDTAGIVDDPRGGATVQMRAPDGSISSVPSSMVDHYKARGAKVVP